MGAESCTKIMAIVEYKAFLMQTRQYILWIVGLLQGIACLLMEILYPRKVRNKLCLGQVQNVNIRLWLMLHLSLSLCGFLTFFINLGSSPLEPCFYGVIIKLPPTLPQIQFFMSKQSIQRFIVILLTKNFKKESLILDILEVENNLLVYLLLTLPGK